MTSERNWGNMALLKATPGSVGLGSMTLFLDSSFHIAVRVEVPMAGAQSTHLPVGPPCGIFPV